jgi:predicted dehydrogenase
VNVVKNNEKPLVSGREGLRTLQVIEAIQKSALTQQSVKVETLEGIRR